MPMRTENSSVDARDQSLGGCGVLCIFRAECSIKRDFFHMDSIKQSRRRKYEHQCSGKPVSPGESDGQKYDQHPEVGGVSNQTVKPGTIKRLRVADRHVGAE